MGNKNETQTVEEEATLTVVDPVQELVDRGFALTTARRYCGVEDPDHGIAPDYNNNQ